MRLEHHPILPSAFRTAQQELQMRLPRRLLGMWEQSLASSGLRLDEVTNRYILDILVLHSQSPFWLHIPDTVNIQDNGKGYTASLGTCIHPGNCYGSILPHHPRKQRDWPSVRQTLSKINILTDFLFRKHK